MTIILDRRLVFLHTWKTGGTWALAAMVRACPGVEDLRRQKLHVQLSIGRERASRLGPHARIAAFVRHPVEWLKSYWVYRTDSSQRPTDDHFWCDCGAPAYETFVANYLRLHPGIVAKIQCRWVGGPLSVLKEPQVDYVGRYENLVEDLIAILRAEEIVFDEEILRSTTPRKVSSKASKARAVTPPVMRSAICQAEAAFIARYYGPSQIARD